MASTSHSSSFSSQESSIRVLVNSINQHLTGLLSDPKTRKHLNSECKSKLKIEKQDFFEFSEQSIISNIYWGIEAAEAAVESESEEDRISRLKSSERMLQVPALLNEHGVTAGIDNAYLICCSYFYLSIIWRLQGDEWQASIHFLQSLVVSPRIVSSNFAPELCRYIFFLSVGSKRVCLVDFEEDEVNEEMRSMAKRYKAWLTYYRVMAYGETSQHHHCGTDCDFSDGNSQYST